jgi:hypothetical protein
LVGPIKEACPSSQKTITLGVLKIFDVNIGCLLFLSISCGCIGCSKLFFGDKFHSLANHPKQRKKVIFLKHPK